MTSDEPAAPRDERAILDELERLHDAIQSTRRQRQQKAEEFDAFVNTFRGPRTAERLAEVEAMEAAASGRASPPGESAAPHIVQERVRIPYEPYPSLVDGTVQIVDRMLDTAPFVSYGEYMEGYLTRLSTAALLNVTAGGGSTVPSVSMRVRSTRSGMARPLSPPAASTARVRVSRPPDGKP